MLADLFDDSNYVIDNQVSLEADRRHVAVAKVEAPRPSCGLVGLANQGATCYLNSLLQILFFTPELRKSLFRIPLSQLGAELKNEQTRQIPLELLRLFGRMLLLDVAAVSTEALTTSFGWTNKEELAQHDVQELNRILFSALEESLRGTSGAGCVRDLYHGNVVNKIECDVCGQVSERQEDFLDLCVFVKDFENLEDSLTSVYVQSERLVSPNQYNCSNCACLVNASKSTRLRHLPPLLTLSLLRFDFDLKKMERCKITSKFVYPSMLDMSHFMEDIQGSNSSIYKLFAVVVHKGSGYGGHYHAYVHDIEGVGKWTASKLDTEKSVTTRCKTTNDLMLVNLESPLETIAAVLRNMSSESAAPIPIKEVCAYLHNFVGISWNSHFKREFGCFKQFLRKHDDLFLLNASGTLVSLLPNRNWSKETHLKAVDDSITQEESDSLSNDRPVAQESYGPRSSIEHWFDFNDSRVSKIQKEALGSQYSGRESAYMLFYRRLDLTPSEEAFYLPSWLEDEVRAENLRLLQERLKQEAALHHVTLSLLTESHVLWEESGGGLRIELSQSAHKKVTLDRRDSLRNLVDYIRDIAPPPPYSKTYWATIVLLSEVLTGWHPLADLEKLMATDADVNGAAAGLVSGCVLLLVRSYSADAMWPLVHGEPLQFIGAEHEPLLLSIEAEGGLEIQSLLRCFPRSMTLFKAVSSSLPLTTHFRCGVLKDDEVRVEWVEAADMVAKSLAELRLDYGCRIRVVKIECSASASAPDTTFETLSIKEASLLSITVLNFVDEKAALGKDRVLLRLSDDTLVEKVKLLAVEKLCVSALADKCRLRTVVEDDVICNHTFPLLEYETLLSQLPKNCMLLALERGEPVANAGQLMLSVSIEKAVGCVELLVQRTNSIFELKCTALSLLRSQCVPNADEWHLLRTNWCGEVAEPIRLESVSLHEAAVGHGQILLLRQGRLLRNGWVRLAIFLLTENEHELEWLTHKQQPVGQGEPYVVLEFDAVATTLADLRRNLSELVNAPSPEHLRLWLIDVNKGQLSTVLRQEMLQLRRLFHKSNPSKYDSTQSIALQLLTLPDAALSDQQVLLTVALRDPFERCYGSAQEISVPLSKNQVKLAPSDLYRAVSKEMQLPLGELRLAKWHSEQLQWQPLPNSDHDPFRKKKGKTKKKSQQRSAPVDLSTAPYLLRDGDLLAAKLLIMEEEPDDFACKESEALRLKKQMTRTERRAKVDITETECLNLTSPPRRKEAVLHIRVPNFQSS